MNNAHLQVLKARFSSEAQKDKRYQNKEREVMQRFEVLDRGGKSVFQLTVSKALM